MAKEPSWRVKTRPCPFYSQGRCLFADSCNFLHNVKITAEVTKGVHSKPPNVRVHSPTSPREPGTPTRTPRFSELLIALQPVIGVSEEDDMVEEIESEEDGALHRVAKEDERDVSPTPDLSLVGTAAAADIDSSFTAEEQTSPSNPIGAELDDETIKVALTDAAVTHQHPQPTGRADSVSPSHPSSLLSPVDQSLLPLISFGSAQVTKSDLGHEDADVDSGYALAVTPLRTANRLSASTLNLLSSPFTSPSARVMSFSPRVGAFAPGISAAASSPSMSRHASEDEGRGDVENHPLVGSLLMGEADTESPVGLVDRGSPVSTETLYSDFGSPEFTPDEFRSEEIVASSTMPLTYYDSSVDVDTSLDVPGFPEDDDYDSLSPDSPMHEDILQALYEEYTSPSPEPDSLQSTPSIYSPQHTPSPTAAFHLDITPSDATDEPPSPILSESSYIIPSPSEAVFPSTTPTTSVNFAKPNLEIPRERVFTPPPSSSINSSRRGRAGTIIADLNVVTDSPPRDFQSPSSASTASTTSSLDSPGEYRRSSWIEHSLSSADSSQTSLSSPKGKERALSEDIEQAQVVEVSSSTRVPFGFRPSSPFTLGGSERSSLMDRRKSLRSHGSGSPSSSLVVATTPDAEDVPAPPLTSPIQSASSHWRLKPLKLLNSSLHSSHVSLPSPLALSARSHTSVDHSRDRPPSSSSVLSEFSSSNKHMLSKHRPSLIPAHLHHASALDHYRSLSSPQDSYSSDSERRLHTAPLSHRTPWSPPPLPSKHSQSASIPSNFPHYSTSGLSSPFDEDRTIHPSTLLHPLPSPPSTASSFLSRFNVPAQSPFHAIGTPTPTLLFAIASDDPAEVLRVLKNGDANPNDQVGPQSALEFTLTNENLVHKAQIVKTLLAFGADPSVVGDLGGRSKSRASSRASTEEGELESSPTEPEPQLDSATKYFVERANAPHTRRTSALINRSTFRPLTRVQYELIGQDRAIEQLFRVLGMHAPQIHVAPIVVILAGPSGHGKSLLARKFGSLLDVPTHTVNMTTLRSTQDLWTSHSISPYEQPTNLTLGEFLIQNEGKRCVVVLDEIEKTANEKTLWSLLMPWELGRCSLDSSNRPIDVQNVVWIGTSNIGHDLVFEHHASRSQPDEPISREEYRELMAMMRPQLSERLGASLLSRVTSILPFVPFSTEEKKAIAAEALYTLAGETAREMTSADVEAVTAASLGMYTPSEGVRSLHRAVSSLLLDR